MNDARPTTTTPRFHHWLAMLKVGLIGFGGGSALIPVMEKELVRPGVLSEREFVQDTVIANITPGALPVKLAALSGTRIGGARKATIGAMTVALPGALGTVLLLALFARLGPGAITVIEYASVGITAFIIYLLGHYCAKVLAPGGRARGIPIGIAVLAFVLSGAGKAAGLGQLIVGLDAAWEVPELSALGLVLLALTAIGIFSVVQYVRRHHPHEQDEDRRRSGQTRRAVRTVIGFTAIAAVTFTVTAILAGAGRTLSFLGLILFSTVTSFGGGEAYVGVADGFFVTSGIVDSSVFYGQIVPVANALPGPILVKIATAIAFVQGGWPLAVAAFLVAVGSCSALAVAVLGGYDRARNSLLIRNVSSYILPVICGLLASTAVAMLHSNARIASEAGVPAAVTVLATIALAASVPLIHRLRRISDALLIVAFGALTLAVLAFL